MKRIEKLTAEQEAMIPTCVNEWIRKGLQTGESDWAKFEKNIKIAYEKAKIPFPNKIIRVNSPLVGALASTISDRIFNNLDIIKKAAKVQMIKDDAVGGAVRGAVGGAVGDAVGGAVRDAVGGAVGDAVGGAVGDAVDGAVGDAVRDAVDIIFSLNCFY